MPRVLLLNAVGLTPRLLAHAPALASAGRVSPARGPVPAVARTAQATTLNSENPPKHGIVGNGWLYRDTMEVRFWQQSNRLLQAEPLYAKRRFSVAKMFWWFNQGAPVDWFATPKPHYGADGSKQFGIIDATGCDLERALGPFPFAAFWGPGAGLASSEWIARASALVMRNRRPDLTLVYLPHLDYDYQRAGPGDPGRVRELDACAKIVIEAAREIDAKIVVVSEYGLVPVRRAVHLNRELRLAGWIAVRDGPYGEQIDLHGSKVFAVCDHQLAHLYLNGVDPKAVRERLSGICEIVEPRELELDHPRSGELIALAKPDEWFAYPYWLDDARAPDFARTVDIHRKPGYDPCELFLTSKFRAARKLLRKKLGFRYLMDVIPLDASLVKGSHGLRPAPDDGPVCVAEEPVADLRQVRPLLERLLSR